MLPAIMNPLHRLSGVMRHMQRRSMSVKADNFPLANYAAFHPVLRSTMRQLDSLAPRFEIQSSQIKILFDPKDFYSLLKQKIGGAQRRVFLSSLYIGKGQLDLVNTITDALDKAPELKVEILVDCLRSTRDSPKDSTASLLAGMASKYPGRVDVRLYHTPNLHGIVEKIVPKRFNEGWGLQHMKIYGFDDEVMLSGANLSEDYFVDRQDRYYLFSSKPLSDYYHSVQEAVGSISYKLLPAHNDQRFLLDWPTSNKASEPRWNLDRYLQDCSRVLVPVLKTHMGSRPQERVTSPDTVVYAVSSFTPLLKPDFSTEKPAILRLLSLLDEKQASFTFTAGYFNMHRELMERICQSQAAGQVITAAREANSFYKSKGVSRYVPDAYLYNAEKFVRKVQKSGKDNLVKLLEWQNGVIHQPNGWSYHAKGIWLDLPGQKVPSVAVVGSSNYTKRAYSRDLETNAIVVTKDPELQKKMQQEVDHLCEHTTQLSVSNFKDPDRHVSFGVKVAATIIGSML